MGAEKNVQALVSQSLRSRIMVSFALCAVAESEIHGEEWERAVQTIATIRQLVSEINLLIIEPHPIPVSTIREAGELAAELESRIQAIEAAIGPRKRYH
jgi:hypothetical protein